MNRSVYFREDLHREIMKRCLDMSFSSTVTRDLERLYTLYEMTLPTIDLSMNEAMLIADALNGVILDINLMPGVLYMEITDAVKIDNLDKKWGVNTDALIEKIKGYSLLQVLTVVDAVERFWNAVVSGANKNAEEILKECFKMDENL